MRYLHAHGWQAAEHFGRSRVWEYSPPDDPEPPFQVLVAADRSLRDYEKRMLDLLEAVARVESRAPTQVLSDLEMPSSDQQFLRLWPRTPSGTAPLVDVVPALSGLKDMMLSAATTADAQCEGKPPAPIQNGQRPARARDFVSGVRLGQTQAGSYILAVQTPIPDVEPQSILPFEDETSRTARQPYARAVTTFLYTGALTAATAAREILRRDTTDVLLEDYAAGGVSANFCEALARIGGEEHNTFGLTFAWSPDLPVSQPTEPLSFDRHMQYALKEGAAALRQRYGQRNALVRGIIVRLNREQTSGPGEITIAGLVAGEEAVRSRRFRVHLGEADYAEAAVAHHEGNEVAVVGDLERRANRTHIVHVREFTVVRIAD
ncbi:hypothetical protein [Embleya sp. NPDC005971]|uniref:hypothetical protein n=1 Tax=Embleya sp. NPDC005971 TaxID=3156724 RepID=UPI0033D508F0